MPGVNPCRDNSPTMRADRKPSNEPASLRARARRARERAETAANPADKKLWQSVADSFERLAESVEDNPEATPPRPVPRIL